ncbi:MAG TPA: type II secretion system protein [Trueperaceae bacterium]
MNDRRQAGITLLELLIALAVISIAFMAFAFSQLQSLRSTSRAQVLTEVKAAANLALETISAEVLAAVPLSDCTTSNFCDQTDVVNGVTQNLSFKFIDYYRWCAPSSYREGLRTYFRTQSTPSGGGLPTPSATQIGPCAGSATIDGVDVDWSIAPPATVSGALDTEGVLDLTVTATHDLGQTLTIGSTITCYDVYPAPKKETPRPCPETQLP